jgi:F-type H+-transporting ATPase subunit b
MNIKFLGQLGIDFRLLIAQIINFGLLLWLLKRFIYRPIIDRIEKDEVELKKAQTETEKLRQDKTQFSQQQKDDLKQTRQQAREVIAEAEEIAEKIKKQAQEAGEEEKQKIIKQIQARLKEIDYEQGKH